MLETFFFLTIVLDGMFTLEVQTKKRVEFIDITSRVQEIISKDDIVDGVCYLFVPHTTVGVTINESADPHVVDDISHGLGSLFDSLSFKHGEGNSPAHIKSSLVGCSLPIQIENNRLLLGTWQGIFFCEFDGPRNRKLHIKIISTQ
jgi:secondary thiamine-phosphate synthase enzyme